MNIYVGIKYLISTTNLEAFKSI